jgi:hypothetical protein
MPFSFFQFFIFLLTFFNGVFVRFSTRGVQNHHKELRWGSPCQKQFAKKVEKKSQKKVST